MGDTRPWLRSRSYAAVMLRPDHDNERVREGALLRIASDLLVPFGELGSFDRFELIEWLSGLGIEPSAGAHRLGPFWVQDACDGPEPHDEVTILRRDDDGWVIGYWERGQFTIRHRFGNEGDACRWMLHHLVSHEVTPMGTTKVPPHVRDDDRDALLAALDEVAALVKRGAPPPGQAADLGDAGHAEPPFPSWGRRRPLQDAEARPGRSR